MNSCSLVACPTDHSHDSESDHTHPTKCVLCGRGARCVLSRHRYTCRPCAEFQDRCEQRCPFCRDNLVNCECYELPPYPCGHPRTEQNTALSARGRLCGYCTTDAYMKMDAARKPRWAR